MIESHAWDPQLDLGHEGMDHEHHLQIALVAAIAEAVEQGRPGMARRLAEQLVAHSEVHFGSEELLMEASRYPGLDAHAGEHRLLVGAMRELLHAVGEEDPALALGAALELRAAFSGHIGGADRRLATRVEARGEAQDTR